MRHGWVLAVTPRGESVLGRLPADWRIDQRRLADGRSLLLASSPEAAVVDGGGEIAVEPICGTPIAWVDPVSGRVRLRRSILSVLEAYWTTSRGSFFAAGSLAALLPLMEAAVIDERALVDHHLFRSAGGSRTAISGVSRLLPGQEASWNGSQTAIVQHQTLDSLASDERLPVDPASARLQIEALAGAMSAFAGRFERSHFELLLSGGVDSTLLQIALDTAEISLPRRSRSYVMEGVTSWLPERDYCADAVRILATDHIWTPIRSADYPALLTDSIALLGRPSNVEPAWLGLFRAAREGGATVLWSGGGADSVYGGGVGEAQVRALRYAHVPLPVLRAAGVVLQPLWPMKALGARQTAAFLTALREDDSFAHPANASYRYADLDALRDWFGTQALVEAAAERRHQSALLAGSRCGFEALQSITLFSGSLESASEIFQLGAETGCTVFDPYLDDRVLRACLRVDPKQRYYLDGRSKPLLKIALAPRVGDAFVARPKRGGDFSPDLYAWMRDGVLADMTRSIERPSFADAASFRRKLDNPDDTTWNLLAMDLYRKHLRSLQGRRMGTAGEEMRATDG